MLTKTSEALSYSFDYLVFYISKKTGASVVGVVRVRQLIPNPGADFVLLPDDLVAIIGNDANRDAFCLMASTARFKEHEGQT